jgi:hypothetical protein
MNLFLVFRAKIRRLNEKIAAASAVQEFKTYKINAETLLEEIDWHSKNNIL